MEGRRVRSERLVWTRKGRAVEQRSPCQRSQEWLGIQFPSAEGGQRSRAGGEGKGQENRHKMSKTRKESGRQGCQRGETRGGV